MTLRNITLGQVADLQETVASITDAEGKLPMRAWKALLCTFRDEHSITDREAIEVSHLDLGTWKQRLLSE